MRCVQRGASVLVVAVAAVCASVGGTAFVSHALWQARAAAAVSAPTKRKAAAAVEAPSAAAVEAP